MSITIKTQKPGRPIPPSPPNAIETRALIEISDKDMFLAHSCDNSPSDVDKRPGVVSINEQPGHPPAAPQGGPNQPAYERYFEGDTSKGNICENSRKTTEFDGSLVTITYRNAFTDDGRMGDDVSWFILDRNHPGASKSGAERRYVEDCA